MKISNLCPNQQCNQLNRPFKEYLVFSADKEIEGYLLQCKECWSFVIQCKQCSNLISISHNIKLKSQIPDRSISNEKSVTNSSRRILQYLLISSDKLLERLFPLNLTEWRSMGIRCEYCHAFQVCNKEWLALLKIEHMNGLFMSRESVLDVQLKTCSKDHYIMLQKRKEKKIVEENARKASLDQADEKAGQMDMKSAGKGIDGQLLYILRLREVQRIICSIENYSPSAIDRKPVDLLKSRAILSYLKNLSILNDDNIDSIELDIIQMDNANKVIEQFAHIQTEDYHEITLPIQKTILMKTKHAQSIASNLKKNQFYNMSVLMDRLYGESFEILKELMVNNRWHLFI